MARWWENYPWRVIQTNMRECDISTLDPKRFVEDLLSFNANAVLVSFGGTLANYSSAVVDHYINPALPEKDVLKELVELCHENNIKVIARTDFSKMHESVFKYHPDWAYREGEGKELNINSYVCTCQNGGFQQQFMDSVIEEIIRRYHVDGIYCNMGSFMVVDYNIKLHGPCQCENCRRLFKEQTGMDLPLKDVPFASVKDPAVAAYQKFKGAVMAAQKKRVQMLIKKLDPSVAYCSVDYVRQETNTEPGRALPHWQYQSASNARAIRGCSKSADCASVDFLGFSARETTVTPALQQYRLWQALANYGGIDYFVMGTLDNKRDKRAYDGIKKIFAFAKEHEELLSTSSSAADVLLVRSSYQIPDPEERGWIRALTELHIPFDETLTTSLVEKLKGEYRLIVLPNKASLPPQVTEALSSYVKKGAAVLCSAKVPARDQAFLNLLGLGSVGPET
ncbi:MAG: hypothetical protein K5634_01765, partial [Sphaerochaetaceae bacterium]|nr:hypothetical protein [Sphaerochaetaceae bacterium]